MPSNRIVQVTRAQCREQIGLVLRTLEAQKAADPAPVGSPRNIRTGEYSFFSGFGSGFFVTQSGTVLTAAHVVDDCDAVVVAAREAEPVWGRVIARDGDVDLAIIETGVRPRVVSQLRAGPDAAVGKNVVIAGYAGAHREEFPLIGGGAVTWLPRSIDGVPSFTFAGHSEEGMSGGPILDLRGRIVGVVIGGSGPRKDAHEDALGIQAPVIRKFLTQHGVRFKAAAASQERTPATLAELAAGATVGVMCLFKA